MCLRPFSCAHLSGVRFASHPFPTRRSSDLLLERSANLPKMRPPSSDAMPEAMTNPPSPAKLWASYCIDKVTISGGHCIATRRTRSEEHTSELQSRFDLVFRLLPEKKN